MTQASPRIHQVVVLIPAYKPGSQLAPLVRALASRFEKVLVLNDGSGGLLYDAVFDEVRGAGAEVISHAHNMGKGAALKTGIAYIRDHFPSALGIVTADADGQHLPDDIEKVSRAFLLTPDIMVIGGRRFEGHLPWKSMVGNTITRLVFFGTNKKLLYDTQTGLRVLPRGKWDALVKLPGEKYDYEMAMLLRTGRMGLNWREIGIRSVYEEGNPTSHFNPFKDSVRIYKQIMPFAASSLLSAGVDIGLFALLGYFMPEHLFISNTIARLTSSVLNYALNRAWVFGDARATRKTLIGYYALFTALLIANYGIIKLLIQFGMTSFPAKLISNSVLFIISFLVQKWILFRNKP